MSGPQFIQPQSTGLSGLGEMLECYYIIIIITTIIILL